MDILSSLFHFQKAIKLMLFGTVTLTLFACSKHKNIRYDIVIKNGTVNT